MKSTLIKDTTKSERIALVKQWEEEEGCENSGMNLMEYFRDYIDGKKEIAEVNAAFRTNYVVETPEKKKNLCVVWAEEDFKYIIIILIKMTGTAKK